MPRIAIIGGGIGGMTAAAFLRRAGFAVTVHEQARRLTEVGAGLILAPNAARPLRRLGVLDRLEGDVVELEWGWEFRRWQDGAVLSRERLSGVCERLYGEATYVVHRARLLDAIRALIPESAVHLAARCTAIEEHDDSVTVRFADGSTTTADIVIGADGIHSVVRETVTEPSPPEDAGICAFRAIVPADRAPDFALRRAHTIWLGPGHHLVHYPIDGGRSVNLVAVAPTSPAVEESWSATATLDEFLAEFEGWDPRVTALIRAGGDPGRWALLDRAPLTRWSTRRVTLLGDAAHPMLPLFAQGAAQSIEDAATLAACLAEHPDDPAAALRRYEAARIPRTTRLQQASRGRAQVNHLPDGPGQRARDEALAAADPLVASGWIYGYDPPGGG